MNAAASFDRIARPYRLLEYLTMGRLLERTRLSFLPRLGETRNALVLGDGDGRFLAQMLASNTKLHATAIDVSAEMLGLLRERSALYNDRLRTEQIDALSFSPPAGTRYDLVATHFFLDCLLQPQLEHLTRSVASSLAPGALWVVSDFRIPSGPMRLPAQILVRSLYLAFRILTGLRTTNLPDHTSSFNANGLALVERKVFLFGVLVSELWQLSDSHH